MISSINTICLNGTDPQDMLQLFEDKCFKITSGVSTTAEFCLGDFAFPSDGYTCVSMSLDSNPDGTMLFDNNLPLIGSPVTELDLTTAYARGIMIKITYPKFDKDDEEILIEDKKVTLLIETAGDIEFKEIPLYNLFTLFTNPKSKDPSDLINRIKIVNLNDQFDVKVDGLIIYDKSE